ncbi:MAG: nucleotide-binding universal stress UspA family protein [Halobacteriales archaeon]|jgi:nucleotide-binding universal stress UspA family protein
MVPDVYDRILFPTDGSDVAGTVLDYVLDLAVGVDATVCVLNVADTNRDSVARIDGEVIDVLEGEGEEVVEAAADRARERGVSVETEVLQGDPYRTIVDYADTRDVGLVAMPTRGRRSLDRFLLGSVTERVVRRSDVPVLTIRPDDEVDLRHPYRNVLVPTDGSEAANDALAAAIEVASAAGAGLHLLHVVEESGFGLDFGSDDETDEADEILESAAETARDASIDPVTTAVQRGSVHEETMAYVDDHDVDLVVVGTHGRTNLDRYLLGSVAEKLVRSSPVPVMTVREYDR